MATNKLSPKTRSVSLEQMTITGTQKGRKISEKTCARPAGGHNVFWHLTFKEKAICVWAQASHNTGLLCEHCSCTHGTAGPRGAVTSRIGYQGCLAPGRQHRLF